MKNLPDIRISSAEEVGILLLIAKLILVAPFFQWMLLLHVDPIIGRISIDRPALNVGGVVGSLPGSGLSAAAQFAIVMQSQRLQSCAQTPFHTEKLNNHLISIAHFWHGFVKIAKV